VDQQERPNKRKRKGQAAVSGVSIIGSDPSSSAPDTPLPATINTALVEALFLLRAVEVWEGMAHIHPLMPQRLQQAAGLQAGTQVHEEDVGGDVVEVEDLTAPDPVMMDMTAPGWENVAAGVAARVRVKREG
jgi:hypothetical protein